MKRVRMLRVAREELASAMEYYDGEREGWGDKFLQEFVHAVGRVRAWPNAWPKMSKRSRRCRFNRFQYGVVYQVRDHEILILAVMYLARKPGYWRNRER